MYFWIFIFKYKIWKKNKKDFDVYARTSKLGVPTAKALEIIVTPSIPIPPLLINNVSRVIALLKYGAIASAPFIETALLLRSSFFKLLEIKGYVKNTKDSGISSFNLPTKISFKFNVFLFIFF